MRRHGLSQGRVAGLRKHAGQQARFTGRLVRPSDGELVHHLRVELFLAKGRRETFLARGLADAKGRFVISVPLPGHAAGGHVQARVLAHRGAMSADEPPAHRWTVVARARLGPLRDLTGGDFGAIEVELAAYRPGPVPRLAWSDAHAQDPLPENMLQAWSRAWHAHRPAGTGEAVAWLGRDAEPARVGEVDDTDLAALWALSRDAGLLQDGVLATWDALGEPIRLQWGPSGVQVHDLPQDVSRSAMRRLAWSSLLRHALVHLVWTRHLLTLEAIALAVRRNLRVHPLADLLDAHLRGVCRVTAVLESAAFHPQQAPLAWLGWPREVLGQRLQQAMQSVHGQRLWSGAAAPDHVAEGFRQAVDACLSEQRRPHEQAWVELARLSRDLSRQEGPAPLVRQRSHDAADDERVRAWATEVLVQATWGTARLLEVVIRPLLAEDRPLAWALVDGRVTSVEHGAARSWREACVHTLRDGLGQGSFDPLSEASPYVKRLHDRLGTSLRTGVLW